MMREAHIHHISLRNDHTPSLVPHQTLAQMAKYFKNVLNFTCSTCLSSRFSTLYTTRIVQKPLQNDSPRPGDEL